MDYSPNDMIAALATPLAGSALALIRISGPGSIEALAPAFSRPEALLGAAGNTLHHGYLMEGGRKIEEAVLSVYRSPASYTGEDSVEISVHGSVPGIGKVLDLLSSLGFRSARPGEFTMRAFLHGKMDLTQAEAVNEIVSAKTEEARLEAMGRLSGSISREASRLKSELAEILASVEIQLDYPEEDGVPDSGLPRGRLSEILSELGRLSESFLSTKIYREGIKMVLLGRTNSGKSSLFNLFLKEERSIVSESHGTTRDFIESWIDLDGIPAQIYDTAGLRETKDPVELQGISRARAVAEGADIIVYLVDASSGLENSDKDFLFEFGGEGIRAHLLRVWNKVDLTESKPVPGGFSPLSARTGLGFPELTARIRSEILGNLSESLSGEARLATERQRALIERAGTALESALRAEESSLPLDLIAQDLKDSVDALGELTGEISTADMLEAMFSKFCVGK